MNLFLSIVSVAFMSLSKTARIMKDTTKILSDLRALMKNLPNNQGQISAYIVPTDDAHQV